MTRIETKRLTIIPFSEKYLTSKYTSWLNDPKVMRYSEHRFKKHTRKSCSAFMNSFKGTPNVFWAITAKDPKTGHIGNLTTYVTLAHCVANIGIMIGERKAWGKGYGTEACKAMCDYLFSKAGIRKIEMGTLSVNLPMLAIMRKLGMADDGLRIKQCIFEGKETDMVYMSLFSKHYRCVK